VAPCHGRPINKHRLREAIGDAASRLRGQRYPELARINSKVNCARSRDGLTSPRYSFALKAGKLIMAATSNDKRTLTELEDSVRDPEKLVDIVHEVRILICTRLEQ